MATKTSKIKTFEDACKSLKLNPKSLPDVSMLPEKHRKSIIAFYKLTTIIEAVNGKWKADWSDSSQYKYYNWFWTKADAKHPSGFGFSNTNCGYTGTYTDVGSRLCFATREAAEYVAKQFESLYKDYLFIDK